MHHPGDCRVGRGGVGRDLEGEGVDEELVGEGDAEEGELGDGGDLHEVAPQEGEHHPVGPGPQRRELRPHKGFGEAQAPCRPHPSHAPFPRYVVPSHPLTLPNTELLELRIARRARMKNLLTSVVWK